jgi:transcriptional regulator with XRE-family HTH domain
MAEIPMDVAYRLRQMREWKKLFQGDIEERTGLFRCYISRLENGHIVPSIETLEKISRALEVPMYQSSMAMKAPQESRSVQAMRKIGHQLE